MANIRFHKKVIAEVNNDLGGYPMNTFLAAGDINGNGWVHLVISGRQGRTVLAGARQRRALENSGI